MSHSPQMEWLHGDLRNEGFSLHAFQSGEAETRPISFTVPPDSAAMILNEGPELRARLDGKESSLAAQGMAYFFPASEPVMLSPQTGNDARFLLLTCARAWFERTFAGSIDRLQPFLRDYLHSKKRASAMVQSPMVPALQRLLPTVRRPMASGAALPFWFQGRVLTLASLAFFDPAGDREMFCSRQQRVARERSEKLKQLLEQNLEQPLKMEDLGRQIGCSPAYLGRIFSQETGFSVPQYLRKIRLQRAAEHLRAGTHNVTEAALEVGYQSLSHFSRAFYEEFGCCPGLYPIGERLATFRSAKRKQSSLDDE